MFKKLFKWFNNSRRCFTLPFITRIIQISKAQNCILKETCSYSLKFINKPIIFIKGITLIPQEQLEIRITTPVEK